METETTTEKTELLQINPQQLYRPLLLELNESLKSLTQAYVAAVTHPPQKESGTYGYNQQSDSSKLLEKLVSVTSNIEQLAVMEMDAMRNRYTITLPER